MRKATVGLPEVVGKVSAANAEKKDADKLVRAGTDERDTGAEAPRQRKQWKNRPARSITADRATAAIDAEAEAPERKRNGRGCNADNATTRPGRCGA